MAGVPNLNIGRVWTFEASSVGGYYHIVSEKDDNYLAHRDTDNDVVVLDANDSDTRRWRFERSDTSGYFVVINEKGGLYLANRTADNNIIARFATDNDSRRWKLKEVANVNGRVASPESKPITESEYQPENEIHFFPNPVTHQLSIYYPGGQAEVTLVSIQGQKLRSVKSRGGKAVIKTTDLPKGVIIVCIQSEDGWQQGKLVIQ